MGSTSEEREYGYRLDEERGSSVARQYQWFANEIRREVFLPAYKIDLYLVTNADYKAFVDATNHPPPFVDRSTWERYGLIHPYETVKRFLWKGSTFPPGRGKHPVVLVTQSDASAFCQWRGTQEHRFLRLPTEAEWEKAARGSKGNIFPWGNTFDPDRLNSADWGPYDTMPVGSFPEGRSPYGVYDMAGMVFEWTGTPCPSDSTKFIVKGGSWDDYPGVTRAAARHCRPASLKHILIGFRCVEELR